MARKSKTARKPMLRSANGWTARRVPGGVRYTHTSRRVQIYDRGRAGSDRYLVSVKDGRQWLAVSEHSTWQAAEAQGKREAVAAKARAAATCKRVEVKAHTRRCPPKKPSRSRSAPAKGGKKGARTPKATKGRSGGRRGQQGRLNV